MKRDRLATIAKQYLSPKSYVCFDGREVLAGEDWKARKFDLWQRADGRCEYITSDGERCRMEAQIPAHVIPRHPHRDDRLSNLMAYCKFHDKLMERQSWRKTRFGEGSKPVCKRQRS